jgi:hypothetical protein
MVMSYDRKAEVWSRVAGSVQRKSLAPGAGEVEGVMKIPLTINCFGNCLPGAFSASLPPQVARQYQSCQMGEKHMLRRQTMTAMSGVFSQYVLGGGMSAAKKETMIARMIAVSFGILWAVVIGLMLNGS